MYKNPLEIPSPKSSLRPSSSASRISTALRSFRRCSSDSSATTALSCCDVASPSCWRHRNPWRNHVFTTKEWELLGDLILFLGDVYGFSWLLMGLEWEVHGMWWRYWRNSIVGFPVGFLRTWEKPGNSWLRLEPWPLILAKLNCIGQDSGNPWMVWKIERSINYVNFDIKNTSHIFTYYEISESQWRLYTATYSNRHILGRKKILKETYWWRLSTLKWSVAWPTFFSPKKPVILESILSSIWNQRSSSIDKAW